MQVGTFDDIESPPVRQVRNSARLIRSNSNHVFFVRAHLKILLDPLVFQEYKLSKKRYFDMISILPSVVIFYVSTATRYNWSHITDDGPFFMTSYILLFINAIVFWIYFISHCIIYYTPSGKRERLRYKVSEYVLLSGFGGRIEDILCIATTLSAGFCLLARVLKGQCEDTTNIWESQSCNPVAALNSIPQDQVIILFLAPIVIQFALRGVSVCALILSWICNLIFVIFSLVHVEGWLELWTIIYALIFMNINWEIERLMRVFFVQNRLLLQSNRLNTEREHALHQINLLEAISQNEKKLAEAEKIQLRSLMGNVAHDLKTPLHSIKADLEVLSLLISKIPKSAIDKAVELLQSSFFQQNFDPQSLFNTMDATCKFMMMSINRSQDYMKASNNIVLLPALKTFDLGAAIAISVNCIKHIESDRQIVVHPFDDKICAHLVSDEHWLIENMLCLLSNAMKYSDKGHVDVHIEVIDAPTHGHVVPSSSSSSSLNSDPNHIIKIRSIKKMESSRQFNADIITYKCDRSGTKMVDLRQRCGRMVLVTVEDSGIGISADSRKDLFQPFKQAQRMAGGTGLGLYSLLKRVEALHGEVGVASRNDLKQGSMFWFTFPYRPDAEAATLVHTKRKSLEGIGNVEGMATPSSQLQDTSNPSDSAHLRHILLIDDSTSVLRVTSRFLLMNGHIVVTASNGCSGLEMLKEAYAIQQYDMVITDIQMPVMDGIEATSRFRTFEREQMEKNKDSGSKQLLIVGMSANSDDQTKQEAINAGMNYFITKPFAYKDLVRMLSPTHNV